MMNSNFINKGKTNEKDMIELINKEIIKSRKERDKFKTTVLGSLKAELINNEKTSKPKKDVDVLISYKKRLEKSIKAFPQGSEAVDKMQQEIDLVAEFCPKQMSEEAIREIVKGVIEKLGTENKGAIIGTSMKIVQRQADGSVVARIISEEISNGKD